MCINERTDWNKAVYIIFRETSKANVGEGGSMSKSNWVVFHFAV